MAYTQAHTFLENEGATVEGDAMPVAGLGVVTFEVTISASATVTFRAAGPSGTFTAIPVVNIISGAVATTATATGFYRLDTRGLDQVRVDVTTFGSGTITARGLALDLGGAVDAGSILKTTDGSTQQSVGNPAGLGDGNGLNTGLAVGVYGFNGTSWERLRTNAAGVISGTTQPRILLTADPGEWSVTHAPAVNTQATASRAAGAAGVRHVCRSITAVLAAGTAAPTAATATINLRDGATGAGSILWSAIIAIPATAGLVSPPIQLSGLNIVGSAATAMTLEFAAASGANTFQSVSLTGYSV